MCRAPHRGELVVPTTPRGRSCYCRWPLELCGHLSRVAGLYAAFSFPVFTWAGGVLVTPIVICLGLNSSFLGSVMVNTPSSKVALIFGASKPGGRVKDLVNLPNRRSMRWKLSFS